MTEPSTVETTPVVSRGCLKSLVLPAVILVLFVIGLPFLREQQQLALERRNVERRQKSFDAVKRGEPRVLIMDPKLLQMLADDADCVANLRELDFSMTKITAEDASHVSRMSNLELLNFYDTHGADFVLENARELPIKKMGFEMARLSKDSLRSLSDFNELTEVHFEHVMFPDEIEILKALPTRTKVQIPHPSENEPGLEKRSNRPD